MNSRWRACYLPSGMVIWLPPPEVTYGTAVLPTEPVPFKKPQPETLAPYVTVSWRRLSSDT